MSKRLKTDTLLAVCPIVYGSIANVITGKKDDSATHKWTLYGKML